MAIKFIPSNKEVIVLEDGYRADMRNMMKMVLTKLNRLELQLEEMTEVEIDCDDGDLIK